MASLALTLRAIPIADAAAFLSIENVSARDMRQDQGLGNISQ